MENNGEKSVGQFPNPDTQFKEGNTLGKGRPLGMRNRSTVLKELYSTIITGNDISGLEKQMPLEVALMTSLAKKALAGDVAAIKEAQDTVYGKVPEKIANTDSDGNDKEPLIIRERLTSPSS